MAEEQDKRTAVTDGVFEQVGDGFYSYAQDGFRGGQPILVNRQWVTVHRDERYAADAEHAALMRRVAGALTVNGGALHAAAEGLSNYAWSAVIADGPAATQYLNELLHNLRMALDPNRAWPSTKTPAAAGVTPAAPERSGRYVETDPAWTKWFNDCETKAGPMSRLWEAPVLDSLWASWKQGLTPATALREAGKPR